MQGMRGLGGWMLVVNACQTPCMSEPPVMQIPPGISILFAAAIDLQSTADACCFWRTFRWTLKHVIGNKDKVQWKWVSKKESRIFVQVEKHWSECLEDQRPLTVKIEMDWRRDVNIVCRLSGEVKKKISFRDVLSCTVVNVNSRLQILSYRRSFAWPWLSRSGPDYRDERCQWSEQAVPPPVCSTRIKNILNMSLIQGVSNVPWKLEQYIWWCGIPTKADKRCQ